MNDVETDPTLPQKPLQRGSASAGDSSRIKVQLPQKESRTGGGSGSAREQHQQDNPSLPTHPGELVVCKKKRNDREKSLVKTRTGSAGPVSPPSMGPAIKSPRSGSNPRDSRPVQQAAQAAGRVGQPSQQPNGSGGSLGWANPVKRLRSDSGKRRPSHM